MQDLHNHIKSKFNFWTIFKLDPYFYFCDEINFTLIALNRG